MKVPAPRRSGDAEIEALQLVCQRLAGFDSRVSLEWLDGALTAVAAGPRVPPLDDVIEALLDDAWPRTFADPQDHAQALAAVQARWRALLSQLDPHALEQAVEDLRVEPLILQALDEDDDWLPGSEWARGFYAVVASPVWGWSTSLDEDAVYADALVRINELTLPGPSSSTRDELIADAAFAAQDLRLWWMDHAPTTATRRVTVTAGRNDPCPCGSGRKYKKCCGAG